jgi:hypothetical protein
MARIHNTAAKRNATVAGLLGRLTLLTASVRKLFLSTPKRRRRAKNKKTIGNKLPIGLILAIIAAVVSPLLIDWLSISEPKLLHIDEVPQTPSIDIKVDHGRRKVIIHIKSQATFKNRGFKDGHVERVDLVPVGLTPAPENIKVIYLDRRKIGWREQKQVSFELLTETAFEHVWTRADGRPRPVWEFRLYFYGADGTELYWESMVLENASTELAFEKDDTLNQRE